MVVFGVEILNLRRWEGLVNFYHKLHVIDIFVSGEVRRLVSHTTYTVQESDLAVQCVRVHIVHVGQNEIQVKMILT